MKIKFLLFFILIACAGTLLAQKIPSLPGRQATEKEQELWEKSLDCSKRGSISFSQRVKMYPFSKSVSIQFVSFKNQSDSSSYTYHIDSLPRANDTVCYSKLYEVKSLTFAETDLLSDMFYNYGYKFKYEPKGDIYFTGSIMNCYNPRNAILFIDGDRRVFEFIEICFECERFTTSSEKITIGIECNQKLEMLKKLFKSVGIKYGVVVD